MSHKKRVKAETSVKKPKQKDDALHVIDDTEEKDIGLMNKKDSVDLDTLSHTELKSLIEKNIKWSQVIYNQNKKIRRRLTMMVIGSYIRLALILVPIIFGIVFLPPLLEQYISQLGSILGGGSGTSLYDLASLLQGAHVNSEHVTEIINQIR